jgi:hypothetical protein
VSIVVQRERIFSPRSLSGRNTTLLYGLEEIIEPKESRTRLNAGLQHTDPDTQILAISSLCLRGLEKK